MDFAKILTKWYIYNRRFLPWRESNDPYKVWLSEVILQQTRVDQGLPYYKEFVTAFPTIGHLARAREKKVLKLWQGLGYYSRARHLHEAARWVMKQHGGKFPDNYNSLLELKGVGEYSAAAIASICFHEPKAVIDGNVYRVLSRVFGINAPIDSTKGKKIFRELANELLDEKDPGNYNQALMEFGALQCVPKNPDCSVCPFVRYCEAYRNKRVQQLPVKEKKTKVRNRYIYYFLIFQRDRFYLKERKEKDIWRGLYDLPMIETKSRITPGELVLMEEWKKIFGRRKNWLALVSDEYEHVLSHQRLFIRFMVFHEENRFVPQKEWKKARKSDLRKIAMPVVIHHFLERYFMEY